MEPITTGELVELGLIAEEEVEALIERRQRRRDLMHDIHCEAWQRTWEEWNALPWTERWKINSPFTRAYPGGGDVWRWQRANNYQWEAIKADPELAPKFT